LFVVFGVLHMIHSRFFRSLLASTLFSVCSIASLESNAMNILLANDDGVTANLKALRTALVAAGHDVLVSVPCQNQSGTGASLSFLRPITNLTTACRGNAAPVGAPGAGPIAGIANLENAYYVNATPVTALLYGLDVLAPQRWGKAPDLVISGPNEGQNVGGIVISSGTVSIAQYAIRRGLPAIAVSADTNTTDNDPLAAEAATLTMRVIEKLERRSGRHGLMPKGLSLNINFPKFAEGASSTLPWTMTRFGNFDAYDVKFVGDLGADPVAAQYGLANVHFPGITISSKTLDDVTESTDLKSEALELLKGNVTLTPMQFGYEASASESSQFNNFLKILCKK
jgi:5'-nucleotidase